MSLTSWYLQFTLTTKVCTYTVFIAKCQNYDGRNIISSGIISYKVPFTYTPFKKKISYLQSTAVRVSAQSIWWQRTTFLHVPHDHTPYHPNFNLNHHISNYELISSPDDLISHNEISICDVCLFEKSNKPWKYMYIYFKKTLHSMRGRLLNREKSTPLVGKPYRKTSIK